MMLEEYVTLRAMLARIPKF